MIARTHKYDFIYTYDYIVHNNMNHVQKLSLFGRTQMNKNKVSVHRIKRLDFQGNYQFRETQFAVLNH